MEAIVFAVIALVILGFGLVSGRIQKSILTAPMVFVVLGYITSAHVLGLVQLDVENQVIDTLAELTLILVLFTDATRIDLRLLMREHTIPVRLLLIGLPLTILLGAVVALPLFGSMGIGAAVVLATILAPTDAALGQAVVSNERVPVRIRQALNVESGLNDGIVLPILILVLSFANAAEQIETGSSLVQFTLLQIGLGPLMGIAVGYVGAKLVEWATRAGWMTYAFQELSALGLAVLAFAAAELIGGNGFIAAFCAGLTVGNSARTICTCLYEFAEAEGQLLTLFVFMLFGSVMLPKVLSGWQWSTVIYAILSLTAVRMIPVALSLFGAKLQRETILFLGWFGPRGLASVLFALLVLERSSLPEREDILLVAMTTVLLSIFVHGITAYPLAKRYGDHAAAMRDEPDMPEMASVTEMPLRLGTAEPTSSRSAPEHH